MNRSVGLQSSPSAASSPRPAPTDWRQESEATCGMACRYHRAVDNLNLQALYMITKTQKIGDAVQSSQDADKTNARIALGPFCKTADEDLKDCYTRYQQFSGLALREIYQSLGETKDAIARLTSGRKTDGSVANETVVTYATGENALPYMPEIPTLSQLEDSYLKGKLKANGSKYSAGEIQKWSQDLVVSNPKAKFLEFLPKTVSGNPYRDDDTTYRLNMLKRNDDGAPSGVDKRLTDAKYDKAVKTVQDYAKDAKDGKVVEHAKVIAPSKTLKTDDKITYDSITQARSVLNSKLEDSAKKPETTSDRTPAGKDPKAKPTPGLSGAPVITNQASNGAAGSAQDVRVGAGGNGARAPSGMKTYGDEETVQRPPEMKNSRYLNYDLEDFMKDIGSVTESK